MSLPLQENLNLLTMSDLRDLLRQRAQQVKGTKSELIDRLTPLLLRESAVAEFVAGLGCASLDFLCLPRMQMSPLYHPICGTAECWFFCNYWSCI